MMMMMDLDERVSRSLIRNSNVKKDGPATRLLIRFTCTMDFDKKKPVEFTTHFCKLDSQHI